MPVFASSLLKNTAEFLDAPLYQPSLFSDVRNVSPWLQHTHWLEELADVPPAPLCESVKSPKVDFPLLGPAVHSWVWSMTDRIHSLSKLERQHLNTDDPLKE